MVFERVLCGVDGSQGGADAASIAARVVDPDGSLVLVTVEDVSLAVHAGFRMAQVGERLAQDARRAAEEAGSLTEPFHRSRTRLVEGNPLDCLRAELERMDATLAVVGTRGNSRAVGIALGSVTTHLLHEARCSVLVARTPREPESWPRSIVVGVDGSPGSAAALAAATELAERHGATLRAVTATREPFVDLEAARVLAPDLEEHEENVLHLLHVLSEEADLVVVGTRGLRGVRALGSISERIAHEAVCSVLVVRTKDD
jgi:nucleotide-binding universal stress UspA family protein